MTQLKDYMEDAQGRLVPMDLIKEIDKTRDFLVRDLVHQAMVLQDRMIAFKKNAMSEIRCFVELSAMEWNVKIGGKKGNITLYSFDGSYRAQVQVSENMVFDEQLQIAKKMIDECLTKWTRQSSSEIKTLINDAFQVDKEGRINTKRILSMGKAKATIVVILIGVTQKIFTIRENTIQSVASIINFTKVCFKEFER